MDKTREGKVVSLQSLDGTVDQVNELAENLRKHTCRECGYKGATVIHRWVRIYDGKHKHVWECENRTQCWLRKDMEANRC